MSFLRSIRWLTSLFRRVGGRRRTASGAMLFAALWLGQAAQAANPAGYGTINQLDAIRDRLWLHDQAQALRLDATDSMLAIDAGHLEADLGGGLVAQWFNWPNWGNWANWNNWNNWGNWRNF